MRQTMMMSAIVAGVLVVAGTAMAASPGSSQDSGSWGIVPVTGPSAAALPEPAKAELIAAVAQGDVVNGQSARKSPPSGTSAAAGRPASHAVKTGHQSAAKTTPKKVTVKKVSAPKHVAKGAGSAQIRHVAATTHQPAGHHAAVSKPIPLTKSQAPTKGSAPAQPVMPRV